jgi:hypothetical protein
MELNIRTILNTMTSAGCIFTNGTHVLGGFQPKKAIISGIGGKPEELETPFETALRETVEELFEIKKVDKELVIQLMGDFKTYYEINVTDYYVSFIFSFEELEKLLRILNNYGIVSPLYTIFPLTLNDLLFKRKIDIEAEISHLCLLPILPGIEVEQCFQDDIRALTSS